jgi:hypothetical protein
MQECDTFDYGKCTFYKLYWWLRRTTSVFFMKNTQHPRTLGFNIADEFSISMSGGNYSSGEHETRFIYTETQNGRSRGTNTFIAGSIKEDEAATEGR